LSIQRALVLVGALALPSAPVPTPPGATPQLTPPRTTVGQLQAPSVGHALPADPTGPDSGVLDVSNTPRQAEGEETVAFNPADPRNIIVGSNQWQPLIYSNTQDYIGLGPSGFTRCAAWSSRDGGRTWQGGAMMDRGLGPVRNPGRVPSVPGEFDDPGNVFSADQHTVFDRQGTAYYTCLDFGVGTGLEVINVWRSHDGGRHWSKPVAAFSQIADRDRQMDRPFLAIDQSHGPRDGTLYVAWERIFYDPVTPEVFVRASRDGGRTWGPVVRVDDAQYPSMQDARLFPMVGADGTLYIVYDSGTLRTEYNWLPQLQNPSLVLASSTDGGRTFSHRWVAQNIPAPTPPDEAEPEVTEFIPSMATDPLRPGRVAVAWPQMVDGASRILLRSSLDGGATWTPPLDVADDPAGKPYPPATILGLTYPPGMGNEHDHAMIRYLPDGRIVVVWRDRRYAGGSWSQPWDIFARVISVGSDGSLYPGRVVRVTTHSEEPTTTHRGHMPSEYLGVAVRSDGIGVSWDEMHGLYPDDVYRFVPLADFGP
jgi:hypothetical protein